MIEADQFSIFKICLRFKSYQLIFFLSKIYTYFTDIYHVVVVYLLV